MQFPTRLKGGKYWVKVKSWMDGDKICLKFPFNRPLLNEIKAFKGARWNPEDKYWSIDNHPRNWFQLAYLSGENPYAPYDEPLCSIEHHRFKSDGSPVLMSQQVEMVAHGLVRRQCEFGAEMGTGKTLAAIEIMERSGFNDWLYVAPRGVIHAINLELKKWKSSVRPDLITYDGLRKLVENWEPGRKPHRGLICDEASRCKNPNAQRSLAAEHFANSIRKEYGRDGYVILMSGTPAPKDPTDWWMQCEIACPGFIREGTYQKFKSRLGLIISKESITGGTYPHLVTWLDDEQKCRQCGNLKVHPTHSLEAALFGEEYHEFVPSKNEIAYLYERMKGLVYIKFKKDCLDLPPKLYRTIEFKPSESVLNAARMITAGAPSTIAGLILLRELSDGFQYDLKEIGSDVCPGCNGDCTIEAPIACGCAICGQLENEHEGDHPYQQVTNITESNIEYETIACPHCNGSGFIGQYKRHTIEVPCPKDDGLSDILDAHEDDGRLIVYGGFTGTIDRIIKVVAKAGWNWIRVDGRGWLCSWGAKLGEEMLEEFQNPNSTMKICFVGQPEAAGMGVTLTAACEELYYSNSFSGEARIQSEDRPHRIGQTRGVIVTDFIHLPTDMTVLVNLRKKRRLQDMTMGVFAEALANAAEERKY